MCNILGGVQTQLTKVRGIEQCEIGTGGGRGFYNGLLVLQCFLVRLTNLLPLSERVRDPSQTPSPRQNIKITSVPPRKVSFAAVIPFLSSPTISNAFFCSENISGIALPNSAPKSSLLLLLRPILVFTSLESRPSVPCSRVSRLEVLN